MKTIIFQKSGTVLRDYDATRKAKIAGSAAEELGILYHLCEYAPNELQIIYFGHAQGSFPCEVVTPNVKGLDGWSLASEQQRGFEQDVRDLLEAAQGEIIAAIEFKCGAPGMSWIGNPKGTVPLQSAVRYQAPLLGVIQILGLPRIIINNDPRSSPKEQEMSLGWDHIVPAAIFDETDQECEVNVGGQRYLKKRIRSKLESWNKYEDPPVLENSEKYDCVIMSHNHLHTGSIGKYMNTSHKMAYAHAWSVVLDENDYYCCGLGWEDWFSNDVERSRACGITEENKISVLAPQVMCSPIVNHTSNFYTCKPYRFVRYGCIPILYGNSSHDPCCVDVKQEYLPFASPWRVHEHNKLSDIVRTLKSYPKSEREKLREYWRNILQPDWRLFDACLRELLDGTFKKPGEEGDLKYGGYRRL
jgi:hypothetical protein